MIQAKFGLNWPRGFRGEDFFKSLQTDDGCQVMAIAHTGELKRASILKICRHTTESTRHNPFKNKNTSKLDEKYKFYMH